MPVHFDSHADPARVEQEIVSWKAEGIPLPAPTRDEVRAILVERAVEAFFRQTRPNRQRTEATFFRVTPRGQVIQLLREGHTDAALAELVDRSQAHRDLDGRIAFDIAQIYRLQDDRPRARKWIRMAKARGSDPAYDALADELE